ncbi:Chromo-like domain superfamily [Sesbania bispinosa]|nr:Chromo-like domain superfamily [Sesbania bispinosa]
MILRGNQPIQQHLVKWEGLEDSHATWEDHTTLKEAYPDFNLEDKVVLNGGGTVTSASDVRENKGVHNVITECAPVAIQVAANPNDQGNKRIARIKITNSRLKDYVWGMK